jgi:hypothetical protein
MVTLGSDVSLEEPPGTVGVIVGFPVSVGVIVGDGLAVSSLAPPPQAVRKMEKLNRKATKGACFLTLTAVWRIPLVVSI